MMGKTAAEGKPHLEAGFEGPVLPLQSASGDTRNNKNYGLAKACMCGCCVGFNLFRGGFEA